MTAQLQRGPVVIDTDVYGADLVPVSRLAAIGDLRADHRREAGVHLVPDGGRARYGALRRNWGAARMRKLEARIAEAETVHSGPELVLTYAQLRVDCERIGHALGQRDHDADRRVAATALRLGVPLVSNDQIFKDVPGLVLESATGT